MTDAQQGIQETADGIRARITGVREQIEYLKSERLELDTGFLTGAEAAERIAAWVDRTHDEFAGHYQLAPLVKRGRWPNEFSLFRVDTRPLPHIHEADLGGLMCFLFGDELKKRLVEVAENLDLADGPPAAERPVLIKELDKQIYALEIEEEALICEAEQAGVAVARHPDCRPEIILEFTN